MCQKEVDVAVLVKTRSRQCHTDNEAMKHWTMTMVTTTTSGSNLGGGLNIGLRRTLPSPEPVSITDEVGKASSRELY